MSDLAADIAIAGLGLVGVCVLVLIGLFPVWLYQTRRRKNVQS